MFFVAEKKIKIGIYEVYITKFNNRLGWGEGVGARDSGDSELTVFVYNHCLTVILFALLYFTDLCSWFMLYIVMLVYIFYLI